jgi:polyisoprenoid-binding protein YceI
MTGRANAALVCMLALAGCAPHLQRAVVSAPVPAVLGPTATPAAPTARAWVVTPSEARFELRAHNALVDQVFTFRSFRARATPTEDGSFAFHAEVDTSSLQGGGIGMASFVKNRLLEVSTYPEATFDGTVQRASAPGACGVQGTLRLHGVERALRFDGTLEQEAETLHLHAVFDLPRKPFNVRLAGVLDGFVPENIGVLLDVHARRAPPSP